MEKQHPGIFCLAQFRVGFRILVATGSHPLSLQAETNTGRELM
jgi:hypothetical protein